MSFRFALGDHVTLTHHAQDAPRPQYEVMARLTEETAAGVRECYRLRGLAPAGHLVVGHGPHRPAERANLGPATLVVEEGEVTTA